MGLCARRQAAVDGLPWRQREAILLLTDGADVSQVAEKQGTTYKAAERIIARARATVKEQVRAACGGIAALLRPQTYAGASRVAVATIPSVILLAGLSLLVHIAPSELPAQTQTQAPRTTALAPTSVARTTLAPAGVAPSPHPTPLSSAVARRELPRIAVPPPLPRSTSMPKTRDGVPNASPTLHREPGGSPFENILQCLGQTSLPSVSPSPLHRPCKDGVR